MMITMMTVIAVAAIVIPIVVPWAAVIAVVPIRAVVSIRIITVSIRGIAIPVTGITNPDSD
jgi:hypothetical protein